jgi:hypothetical protein
LTIVLEVLDDVKRLEDLGVEIDEEDEVFLIVQ